MSGVTGQTDLLPRFDPFTDVNKCPVLLQVVILTGGSVVMHDDNKIGVLPASILPASFVVRLLDARNDPVTGGVNRRANVHSEINSILLDTAVAKPGIKTLDYPVTCSVGIRHQVNIIVIM